MSFFTYLKKFRNKNEFVKNRQQEVERVAKYKVVSNWHIFVSIVGRETEENVEKYSQSGYCSFTITYF